MGRLRLAWRALTSMQTALVLLVLLALAAVPGSVFPQRRVDAGMVQMYLGRHRVTGPWLDRLGMFDVYAAPWFAAIYLLLFVSLIGCVLPRSRRHWRQIWTSPPRTPSNLSRLPAYAAADIPADLVDQHPGLGDPVERATGRLRRRGYRVAVHDGGLSAAAERGFASETGNLLFHLALLALLGALAAGSLYGWSGQALVVEGTTFANSVSGYDSFRAGSRVDPRDLAPFTLGLDTLRVRFEESPGAQLGAPRDFRASLTLRASPRAASAPVVLRVNQPLSVRGVRVFLVGNGYAPVVTVRDGTGRAVFSGPVPFLVQDGNYTSVGVIKVPDARPRQLALAGVLLPTAYLDPVNGPVSVFPDARRARLLLTAYSGELGLDDGVPQSVYRLDTSRMTQLRGNDGEPVRLLLAPGERAELPDGAGTVTFDGLRRYAGLDVRYDPAKWVALGAAASALIGLLLSLFVRRRRLWVRWTPPGPGLGLVEVAGLTRGDDPGLDAEVRAVLSELVGSGSPPAVPAGRGVLPPTA